MGRNKKCFLFRCFQYWIIIMILGKRMIIIYVYIDQVPLETRPLSHTSVSMERTGLIGLEKWVSKFFIGQYLICLRHHQIQTIYSTTVDLEQRGLDKQFFLYCTFYILFLFICCKVHYAWNSFDDDDESKYVVENVHNLGPHTLQLQVVLNESGSTIYAGKSLPSHQIKFTITGLLQWLR